MPQQRQTIRARQAKKEADRFTTTGFDTYKGGTAKIAVPLRI